jgi:hypothetical protein
MSPLVPTLRWIEPNVMVEWLPVLLPIRKVSGSNFVAETSYFTKGLHYFPQYIQENAVIVP